MDQNEDNAGESTIPAGFTMFPAGGDGFIIHHVRRGMGCLNLFIMVGLVAWGIPCVYLHRQYLNGGTMDDGTPIPPGLLWICWSGEVVIAGLLAYLLGCKKSFRAEGDFLRVETDVLGFRRSRRIPKNRIRRFVQVKDGGEDEDSFPSWGLKVEADKMITLLYRQPYEKSHWLGQVLAHWAEVDFIEAPSE